MRRALRETRRLRDQLRTQETFIQTLQDTLQIRLGTRDVSTSPVPVPSIRDAETAVSPSLHPVALTPEPREDRAEQADIPSETSALR